MKIITLISILISFANASADFVYTGGTIPLENSAIYLPSITCYNILNASHSLTIKALEVLPSESKEKKVYLSHIKTLSGPDIYGSEFDANLEVSEFSSGRRSGFTYSSKLPNKAEILLSSSCLYSPDVCSSRLFTGKITEASGAVSNLTCKFE